ncbi:hypothetical protein [Pontibacter beigongshangensis]|uniref:hypothetical protein n=1 Tax=Pontibacter beigongshangensis TaxID=2574733 RepID=UPI0016504990|nr:hypothetical protein [Pontibacter beigongshangensis]
MKQPLSCLFAADAAAPFKLLEQTLPLRDYGAAVAAAGPNYSNQIGPPEAFQLLLPLFHSIVQSLNLLQFYLLTT